MMDRQALQELKQRVDLVDLIGQTVNLKREGTHFKGLCPLHDDRKTESLVVYPDIQRWQCFGACNRNGDCLEWEMALNHMDFTAALSALETRYGGYNQSRELVKETTYDIVDTKCILVAQHVRRDFSDGTKEYWWRRDGQYNLGEVRVEDVPLFGMKGLVEAAPGADVIITEGEKAAASLIARGCLALGTVTGASGCPSQSVFEPLIGSQRVYLWPDNDDVGLAHMQKVAGHLQALGIPASIG
jgi:DNA primase